MIVYASEYLDVRGSGCGIAAGNELRALLSTGWPVVVITENRVSLFVRADDGSIREPEWILSHMRQARACRWRRLDSVIKSMVSEFLVTRKIRRLKPELLIVQGIQSHRRIEQYRSWEGVSRLITIHSSPDQFSKKYTEGYDGGELLDVCKSFQKYTGMVQVSSRLSDEWHQQPGLSTMRMPVIPNTIREDEVSLVAKEGKEALREHLGMPKNAFILTCVGTLQYRKGQDILLDSMEEMRKQVPGLELYLVGPWIMDCGGREMVHQIKNHSCVDKIHLTGWQTSHKALQYVRASDLFILPSREEAMPLSVLEAMCLGTPVVASCVNGIPDIVRDGQTGCLFSHDKPADMIKAVVKMQRCEQFALACAQSAKKLYWQSYSNEVYFKSWAELVNEYMYRRVGI